MFEKLRKIDWLLPVLIFVYFNLARFLLRSLHLSLGLHWFLWFLVNAVLALACLLYMRHVGQTDVFRIGRPKFKWIALTKLGVVLLYFWLSFVRDYFPVIQNESGLDGDLASAQGLVKAFMIGVICFAAPINEEIITRAFALQAWSRFKKYGLDILLAAGFFAVLHLYSWSWTDFLAYFGMALVYVLLLRISRTIYCPLALHIFLNTIITLVQLGR